MCRGVMLEGTADGITLDVCQSCHMVWFDAGEYESAPLLPERGARTLPEEALEKIARAQAAAIAAEYKIRFGGGMTVAEALPLVPGIAGLPLEGEQRGLSRWPLVTWALAAFLTALGLWSLGDAGAVEGFGLTATDVDHLGGATLVTALVVHAGWFQLVTNVYFLLIFGDNVEDLLGPATFGLLLFTGGVAGNVLHAIFDASEATALVGASGVVSAIVVFYACASRTLASASYVSSGGTRSRQCRDCSCGYLRSSRQPIRSSEERNRRRGHMSGEPPPD